MRGIAKITSLDSGFAMSGVSLVLKVALMLRRLMNQSAEWLSGSETGLIEAPHTALSL